MKKSSFYILCSGGILNYVVCGQMQDAETLMVKFSRAALIPSLIPEQENVLQVGGAVTGEDTIMVIDRGGKKK